MVKIIGLQWLELLLGIELVFGSVYFINSPAGNLFIVCLLTLALVSLLTNKILMVKKK